MSEERSPGRGFTGWRRRRTTSLRVRLADRLARAFITLGGLGTIVAIATVCVFLLVETAPLFRPPSGELRAPVPLPTPPPAPAVAAHADEYGLLAWSLLADGSVELRLLSDGRLLRRERLFPDAVPVDFTVDRRSGEFAAAFADGSVREGKIAFEVRYLDDEAPPPELADLGVGEVRAYEGGVVERTREGQLRLETLALSCGEPVRVAGGAPLLLVDRSKRSTGPVIATLDAAGTLRVQQVRKTRNLLTGEEKVRLRGGTLALPDAAADPPKWLRLAGLGDNVYLVWEDGRLLRVDARDLNDLRVAERSRVTDGARVTCVDFLIGKTSLVVGDEAGGLGVWFRIKPEGYETVDGAYLAKGHDLGSLGAPIAALAPSVRSRVLAATAADGSTAVFYVTSERRLVEARLPEEARGGALVVTPKDDAVLARGRRALARLDLRAPHPEITLRSVFRPVWYEGYTEPAHVWQSSSGTDDFEPKYGLWPLVFGTLKATFYSMLFGLPIALLAALYTSEFMSARWKARVKPTIEIMAGLPSVVLGFLAGIVFAPLFQEIVPEVLTGLVTVPFCVLLVAHVWRALPGRLFHRWARFRVAAVAAALPLGAWMAVALAPWVERRFFAGDLFSWLDGQIGDGTGGLLLLLLPLSALLVSFTAARSVSPWMRRRFGHLSRSRYGLVDLVRFLALSAATALFAYGVSYALARAGLDPRGAYLGTYVQRNAFVVGVVMGFAIIPIIYTIAEDALSAVPEHLRAASLGAGATPWQTAVRVIVPTAMSGLFSAAMVGLGRAVGETMIVLMAAGNTPVLDWNVFNGFRTLSANIAVELPEAVVGSTHYRMLFFAALLLFAVTFLVNTVAESVRLRFRRRAFQL